MKLRHEEIMDMLPEYQKDHLNPGRRNDIETHIKGCRDCWDTLYLISRLQKIEVHDPGEVFWKTLPQKVRASIEKPKTTRFSMKVLLFGPLSIPVSAAILILSLFAHTNTKVSYENELFLKYLFDEAGRDYSNLNESDINIATNEMLGKELFGKSDDFAEYSYDDGLTLLSEKDLNSLDEELKRGQQIGG